ncbi:MAG TPA: entericidin EcnAB [Opitutae bacterium]|nr:entericidin EcnAB [Opitutae bacterium]
MYQLFLATVLTVALLALSGCNTWKGLGEDFQSMGESMQKSGS